MNIAFGGGLFFVIPAVPAVLLFRRSVRMERRLAALEERISIGVPVVEVTGKEAQQKPMTVAQFDPYRHRDEITRAVCVKRKILQTDFQQNPFCHTTNFIEFVTRRGELDVWLVQEIEETIVTKDFQRQMQLVSLSADAEGNRCVPKVIVIVLVYKSMSLDEKGSLMRQLETVKANDALATKLSFQVWDKDDL